MWNFQFWVIGIRKKECTAFEPVGERNVRKPELLVNQKTLSTKKNKNKNQPNKNKKTTEAFLYSSYQESICLVCYMDFLDGFLC